MNNFDFDDFNLLDDSPRNASISIISDIDATKTNIFETEISEEKEIPILPLRNTMLFPGTLLPITIGRRSSLRMINEVSKSGEVIGVFSQKDDSVDSPDASDLYEYGVIAKVVKVLELPDGHRTALMQGFSRVGLKDAHDNGDYLVGHVFQATEMIPNNRDREFNAVVEA